MDIQRPNLTCEGHTAIYGGSAVRNPYMWIQYKEIVQSPRYQTNTQMVDALLVSLRSAAHRLRGDGWRTRFISFQPEYDKRVVRLLREKGEDVRGWEPQHETIEEFLEYLASFRILVTMRAHGVLIGALLGGVPIAILIEPKLEIFAAQSGCPDCVITLQSSSDEIVAMIKHVAAREPTVHNWQSKLGLLAAESNRLRDWLLS